MAGFALAQEQTLATGKNPVPTGGRKKSTLPILI
jgi:hypothetical protein